MSRRVYSGLQPFSLSPLVAAEYSSVAAISRSGAPSIAMPAIGLGESPGELEELAFETEIAEAVTSGVNKPGFWSGCKSQNHLERRRPYQTLQTRRFANTPCLK